MTPAIIEAISFRLSQNSHELVMAVNHLADYSLDRHWDGNGGLAEARIRHALDNVNTTKSTLEKLLEQKRLHIELKVAS
jgi:hypothetical protein